MVAAKFIGAKVGHNFSQVLQNEDQKLLHYLPVLPDKRSEKEVEEKFSYSTTTTTSETYLHISLCDVHVMTRAWLDRIRFAWVVIKFRPHLLLLCAHLSSSFGLERLGGCLVVAGCRLVVESEKLCSTPASASASKEH